MLVKKSWITVEPVKVGPWHFKMSKWKGFFLFGFIPVYVYCWDYTYEKYGPE